MSEGLYLKAEPYFQYLYHIPVEPSGSFSLLNYNAYGLDKKLVNEGKGRNYGVDVTVERPMRKGWYALFTGSLFKSEYKGGDHVWRGTRMDQRFIVHALAGKEWFFGKNKQKSFSANIRLTYQGGYRYTPIVEKESQISQAVEEDETQAYRLRLQAAFITDLTLKYRINKRRTAHEFSLMILNATGFRQTGYAYNLVTHAVEKKRSAPVVPNISWKICF